MRTIIKTILLQCIGVCVGWYLGNIIHNNGTFMPLWVDLVTILLLIVFLLFGILDISSILDDKNRR